MNETAAARILCVDDEPSILSALKRVFRPAGHAVLTAGSGQEGLELLAREPVDLVISDMRMPAMDGAQFLEQVFQRWPETERILLTGYADASATVAAVNRGKIWAYIAKPWNPDELLLIVDKALAHGRLVRENARLIALTQRQNEELKAINAGLEQQVATRTAELQQTVGMLEAAQGELKKSFLATVRVLANLFEMRDGRQSGHSRRVADVSRQLTQGLGLDEAATQNVVLAALLHDIGKIGLPDYQLDKAFNQMTSEERARMMEHPARGEMILGPIKQLENVARLVRSHHECFDGRGYPDRLAGLAIPLGARILAVANDFDALQQGTLVSRRLKPAEARAFIEENRSKRYDPAVVDVFMSRVADSIPEEAVELTMRPGTLAPGMVLARDLMHPDGYLLLARGQVVDPTIIAQLVKIESTEGHKLTLHLLPPQK